MDLDDVRASLIMRNEISVPQIMKEFDAPYTEAREAIKELEESGEIKRTDGVTFVSAEEVISVKNSDDCCAIVITSCDRPLDERKFKMLSNKAKLSPEALKEKLKVLPCLICRGGSEVQLHHMALMMRISFGMGVFVTSVAPDYKRLSSDKMFRAERATTLLLEIMASDLGLTKEHARYITLGLLDEAIEKNAPDRVKNAMADTAERLDSMSEAAFEEYKKILTALYKSNPSHR